MKKKFDIINLQKDFNSILSFLSELCEVPHLFISLVGVEGQIIKADIGFDFLTIPGNIVAISEEIIQHNKITIVNNSFIEESKGFNSTDFSYDFFAGFPICIDENIVVGTLCIMDNLPKELSSIQLKSLHQAVLQIQSLLKLHVQNKKIKAKVLQRKNQVQQIINNSNIIFYEASLDGIITKASKTWTLLLGHDLDKVIGKKFAEFIHPEDIEKCESILKALSQGYQDNEETLYRILHHDEYYVWHSSYLKFIKNDGIEFYTGNCRDITVHIETQQKLKQQKEFYEKILDRVPTDIAVFDRNYKYTYLNPAAIKDDESRKFIIGKDDFEYAEHTGRDNEFAKNRRAKFMEAIENKGVIEWEDAMQHKNGETTCHIRKFAPVFFEDGSLEMMVGSGVDITESKKIQDEIFKSRQLTKSIIQNVAVGISIHSTEYEILEINKASCEMFGFTRDQLLGKTPFDKHWKVIHADCSEFFPEEYPVTQAVKQLKPLNNIIMGVHRHIYNDLIWLLVDAVPVFDDFGKFLYVVCSYSDITSRKIAEDYLRISNERFVYSNKATSEAIWDWDFVTGTIYIGEGFSTLFGHKFDNNYLVADRNKTFIHPDDRKKVFQSRDKALESEIDEWHSEYRYLKSDGDYAYVKDDAVIIRNGEGKAVRAIGTVQDITKEKRLKDELKQSEEQFKGAFEHSAVGMAIVNMEGYWIEANNRLCEILGYSKEEFKILTFEEITYSEDLEEDLENKKKLVSGEATHFNMEKRYIHKNKSLVWVHLSVSVVRNSAGKIQHYIPQIIDISERKRIEEQNKLLTDEINRNKTVQLNEAKNMYRLLADNTDDLVCLHNINGFYSYVSPSIYKLLGYTPEELLGRVPSEFVHPQDNKILKNRLKDIISEKKNISFQVRFRNKEGSYIWFESKAILIKENGVPSSFRSSSRDITQEKEAEKIIKDTLIQEQELNELRTNLVSTISHEFRTPMTTIRTSAELISMYLEGHNFVNSINIEKRVNTITEQIDRIVELMNAVLTISKEESGKTNFNPILFDLKQLCLDVIDSSCDNYDKNRKVQTSFEGNYFYIFADKNLMEYCIFNILNNAFKYSRGLGDIIFRVFASHDTIVIEIIDFGIGIPEQDQSKLFNTFFRASNTNGFQGTGLGLYIVKTFAQKNSGTVHIESQLGKGTKVTLKFPLKK
ncbi:PAS domain-containing protein [Flavobacterium cellulosilyticum]|uniref:histidine kinase n=1 Tax=Flavobacterium cellulosilyticum TaxID=2541731 RepID=A0A4R5CD12_9FLAO|nr:PAS domain S-box protein [Flavobacterium cellulosilyticum]TDD95054.1 PAS domain S-box protein [Flavobacterium cellulosilyticum]